MKNVILSLAIVGLLLVGCSQESDSKSAQASKKQMPPVPVKAFDVTLQDTTFSKSYPALLKSYQEVEVVARVSGVLEKENFVEGSFVKKGTLLYEIQKNEYKAALDSADAMLQKSGASFVKASKDFKRAKQLIRKKSISEQQYDTYFYEEQVSGDNDVKSRCQVIMINNSLLATKPQLHSVLLVVCR
jgi:membrane fusion protein (multidrug efflux system)